MAPVAGRPFVEWVLRYLAGHGLREAVISTGYRAEVFAEHFAAHAVPGMAVSCIAEPEPMGTAGGFLLAATTVNPRPDAWLVLNGDSLILADLAPLLRSPHGAALLALWMEDAARYGSLDVSEAGDLIGFREKRPGPSWINGGVYFVRDELLARFPKKRPLSWETDVFPHLLETGVGIAVSRARAPFLDIGLPETLAQAESFIRENAPSFGGS